MNFQRILTRSFLVFAYCFLALFPGEIKAAERSSNTNASVSRKETPVAITLAVAHSKQMVEELHRVFPKSTIREASEANAVIVQATPDDLNAIRMLISVLDVKSVDAYQADVIVLHNSDARSTAMRLKEIFPDARFIAGTNHQLLFSAQIRDLAQIRVVAQALDAPLTQSGIVPTTQSQVFSLTDVAPRVVINALRHTVPHITASESGTDVIVSGFPDDVLKAKTLISQLDKPNSSVLFSKIYRLVNVDAASMATLLQHSYPESSFSADPALNALTVHAVPREHARIESTIVQLDVQNNQNTESGNAADVIALRAAIPTGGANGASTATEIANAVTQALASGYPDLKITVEPNATKLILSGSERSRDQAKKLIDKLDVAEPLVELDTQVLEIDEGLQSQLGLKFPTPVLGTTYSEIPASSNDGSATRVLRLQPLSRTPLSLTAELDFLVSNNQAKILEDPRITTFSGRTATIRAGETVNILTTAGGGTGTVATTQVQSFQTGVTLDITPVVNTDGYITVTLHPTVNSIAGVGPSGVPNIQTRDTTTTIGLHDGETLVIGGLIEDTDSKSISKIPLLGDLPIIGRLFQDVGVTHTRNELVVTVTPHILKGGDVGSVSRLSLAPTTAPKMKSVTTEAPGVFHLSNAMSDLKQSIPNVAPTDRPNANHDAIGSPSSAAFKTNEYIFGSPPTNNYADESQPPKVFYVLVSPTVVEQGTPVRISVLTTTNVSKLSIGADASSAQESLTMKNAGEWEDVFNFDASRLPSTSGNVSLLLTATTAIGTSTMLRIPFSIPQNTSAR